MKELVVISGKGGTGKTCLTAAFSSLADKMILCDADVDAADLHLIAGPSIRDSHDFQAGHTAIIDKERCSECGLCQDLCRWQATERPLRVMRTGRSLSQGVNFMGQRGWKGHPGGI